MSATSSSIVWIRAGGLLSILCLLASQPALGHNVVGLAIADFDRRIAADPANPRLRLGRAGLYLELGNLDGAEADLLAVLGRLPQHVEATRLLATIHLQRRQPGPALARLQRLPEAARRRPDIGLEIAAALMQKGRRHEARGLLSTLAQSPDAPAEVHLRLARLDVAQGRVPAARDRLARLLRDRPTQGEAARRLAHLLAEDRRFEPALKVIDAAIEAGADSLPLKIARAGVVRRGLKAGAPRGAIDGGRYAGMADMLNAVHIAVQERIEWNEGEVARDFVLRARVHLLRGAVARGRQDLRRALDLAPQLAAARDLLATIEE